MPNMYLSLQDEFGLELLRSTIITDTINLSPAAKKATPLDISTLELIEKTLPNSQLPREDVFSDIFKAKSDIKGFTVEQLLRKDLKIVPFSDKIQAAVPSTLLLAEELCEKGGELENLETIFNDFCQRYKSQLLIIIGTNQVRRDILFYHPEGQSQISKLINQITESLINYAEIDAKIDLEFKTPSSRCVLIKQGNITYTRKKILPIILNASSMIGLD